MCEVLTQRSTIFNLLIFDYVKGDLYCKTNLKKSRATFQITVPVYSYQHGNLIHVNHIQSSCYIVFCFFAILDIEQQNVKKVLVFALQSKLSCKRARNYYATIVAGNSFLSST